VPTTAERAGDFSGAFDADCTSAPVDPLTGDAFPGNHIPQDRLSPAGLLVLQLYPAPNVTPSTGSCNNWVTSVNTPINWRQENLRVDWSINNKSHLMVRYTQDSWTNKGAERRREPVGRRPVPGGRLELGPAGPLAHRAVHPEHRRARGQHAHLHVLGQRDHRDARRRHSSLNDQINAAIRDLSGQHQGVRRQPRPPGVLRRESYGDDLQNMAPFKNNQNLFVLKDDYSAGFGKHFFKAGIVASYNQKNEDVFDWGSASRRSSGTPWA
jgi:hypothetical protein